MQRVKLFTIAFIAGLFLLAVPQSRAAQISVSVNIGPQPVCPYGYFSYSPYNCAPYGYYGPAWFSNSIFIGAGPWYRGPAGFHGYVNRNYDPRYGYRGRLPRRGERGHWRPDRNFHGNYEYDGRGNGWHGNNPKRYENHGHQKRDNDHGNRRNDHGHGNGNGNGNHGDHGNGNGNGNGHGHGR